MGLGRELRDPWALVLAGIAGGLGWAVGVPALAAAGIGAAVFGARVVTGTVVNRGSGAPGVPSIRQGSPQAAWVQRAQEAVRSLRRLGATASPGPVADRVSTIGSEASRTLEDVRRLAIQASGMDDALTQVDPDRLMAEADRLDAQLMAATHEGVRDEVQRSLDSIRAQMDVRTRLENASAKLQARIEAVVLGLESLVARLVEVLAMMRTQSPIEGADQVDALAQELEGLRAGLAETEELSRRALVAYRGGGDQGTANGDPGSPDSGRKGRLSRFRQREGRDAEAP
ncbi:MAG TPA: hypothetical protein VEM93_07415 [Actinomycetota bacterium]|nr:hypothetical protein [Actinomycetota bacterium]